jgi:hypothetical protein
MKALTDGKLNVLHPGTRARGALESFDGGRKHLAFNGEILHGRSVMAVTARYQFYIRRVLLILPFASIFSCCVTESTDQAPKFTIRMDQTSHRDALIGKWVRVEGVISVTKQTELAGIDVDTAYDMADRKTDDLRGQNAWAEGIVVRYTVTSDEVNIYAQNRGAGIFYELINPFTGKLAVAHPMSESKP